MTTVYHGATAGVVLTTGFATKNPVTIASDGTVSGNTAGYRGAAIYASGYAWTIANRGTVAATGSGANGVTLEAGGVVVNGGSHATSALISGVYTGIATYAAPATITNYGTIVGTGTAFHLGGYISGLGIYLGGGGRITNGASGSTAATIAGYTTAISIQNTAATIVNFGTLQNTAFGDTIYLGAGATGSTILNKASGLITGRSAIDTTPATAASGGVAIANYGTIANTDSTAPDIYLGHGGQVTNGAGGLIAGLNTGVVLGAPGTVVDSGAITGGSGTAIAFGGSGGNLLALEHGYQLGGSVVVAGGANTLELLGAAGAVTVDFDKPAAGFTHFGTVAFGAASGHDETLTISSTAALPGTIAGFTQLHDIVDLTQLTPKGASATLNASDQLVVVNGSQSVSLQLDPGENYGGVVWRTTHDGKGGTDVAVQHAGMSPFVLSASLAAPPLSPSFGFADIAGVPGSPGGAEGSPAGSMPVSGGHTGASLFQSTDGGIMAGVDPTLLHITLFG